MCTSFLFSFHREYQLAINGGNKSINQQNHTNISIILVRIGCLCTQFVLKKHQGRG